MTKRKRQPKRKDAPPKLWVLVDKRGAILKEGDLSGPYPSLYHHGGSTRTVPLFTFWKKRADAYQQRKEIKDEMTPEVWATWQFQVAGYTKG